MTSYFSSCELLPRITLYLCFYYTGNQYGINHFILPNFAENHSAPPHYRKDISLTFVCLRFPRKLVKYLTEECKIKVANSLPGIYNVSGEILQSRDLVEKLAQDYTKHQSDPLYENYMNQLINANMPKKGDSPMCCEGIFRLYGTSSKEIAANAAKEAVAPIMEELNKVTEDLNAVKKQNDYLRQLLDQHGIAYNL